MDPVNDTIRDAPSPAAAPRGKASVWLMLIFAGLVALTSGVGMAGELHGESGALEAEGEVQLKGMGAAQRARIEAATAEVLGRWEDWLALVNGIYALAAGAVAALALAIIIRDRERLRATLMLLALAAALARGAVGFVMYSYTGEVVSVEVKALAERPSDLGPGATLADRAAAARHEGDMSRAASMTSDIASTMLSIETVVVALIWLIGGALVVRRREEPQAQPSPA